MSKRPSGIPTPGRSSSIPTPGRSRSTSSATAAPAEQDVEFMSRAFADAIKAHDPAQHRSSRASDVSTSASSLSPLTISHSGASISGRSSVASSSSAVSASYYKKQPPERTKTPTSTRPPSRQSDIFARSSSRAGRAFEVGDNVRIESLGFEGTLRYLGEIDGKPGLWAGVELGRGFAGKGKNNGSVGGRQYFSCPDKCGVFVATTKLSAPTVGPGAVVRPSSVASSRGGGGGGGRTTPSFSSGRITPSTTRRPTSTRPPPTNGRVTPSGRTTPSFPETPAVRAARLRAMQARSNAGATPTASSKSTKSVDVLSDKITSGSRASKYMSMTAQQLNNMNAGDNSMSTSGVPSPSRITRNISSPSRTIGSPFNTPKPRLAGAGGAGVTPKPRVPSAVAMPPPASPSLSNRGHPDDEILSSVDLEQRGKALQDKIAALTSINKTPSSSSASIGRVSYSPRRPESSTSVRSSTTTADHIDVLQSRIDALEYENERLRSAPPLPPPPPPPVQSESADSELLARLNALSEANTVFTARVEELEATLADTKSLVASRDVQLETQKTRHSEALSELQERFDVEQQRANSLESSLTAATSEVHTLQGRLEDSEKLVKSLKDVIEEKTTRVDQDEQKLSAERAEWAVVEARLKKVVGELEEDKKDLAMQVDELRQAGQETIALYEERMRAADIKRYELEDRITELEAKAVSPKSRTFTNNAPTTAQIDNEALHDQIVHLQKKVSTLEDIIEDSRVAAEREETVINERMRRIKEKEDALKKELSEGRKEVERVLKSEVNARHRVEEIEDALRESGLALENAQGEIEGLRAELDNLNGLVASNSANGDQFEAIRTLESQITSLKRKVEEQESQLVQSEKAVAEQAEELDALRKKVNRDVSINNGVQDSFKSPLPSPSPSKHDASSLREEIKGLKHIVQELRKEASAAAQQKEVLESENRLLKTETDQLRQEVHILEENLDQSIMREEQGLNDDPSTGPDDVESLRKMLKEQRLRFETDLEQLRKKLADAEMKNNRTLHDLNKEISELEALVESKIYREDELEQEIERLKDKLARQKKSSKSSVETTESRHSRAQVSSSGASVHSSNGVSESERNEAVCEICEQPGHDIFSCSLLRDDPSPSTASFTSTTEAKLFCDECEQEGHLAADCPNSMDVF